MTVRKTVKQQRAIKQVKRRNAASPAGKRAPKKEHNDDRNNTLEGYDEDEYDQRDKEEEKRKRSK